MDSIILAFQMKHRIFVLAYFQTLVQSHIYEDFPRTPRNNLFFSPRTSL